MYSNVNNNTFVNINKKFNIKPFKRNDSSNNVSINPDDSQKQDKETNDNEKSQNTNCYNLITSGSKHIKILDIIKDFRATMTAVGLPKSRATNILENLENIKNEANQSKPNIAEIQQNLRSSSKELDSFISETLGNASTVVSQWMDTLLIQKIDYEIPTKEIDSNKLPSEHKETASLELVTNQNDSSLETFTNPLEINQATKITEQKNIFEDKSTKEVKLNQLDPINYKKDIEKQLQIAQQQVLSGNTGDSTSTYQQILRMARANKDITTQRIVYTDVAEIHDSKNNYSKALTFYNKALKLAANEKSDIALAKIHYNIGSIYEDLGMITQSLKHYYASVSHDGESGKSKEQSQTLNNIACLHSSQKEFEQASILFQESLNIAKELKDIEAEANILSNMGQMHFQANEPKKAIKCFRNSLKLDKKNNDLESFTKNLTSIGDSYEKIGLREKSQNYFKNAYKYHHRLENPNLVSYLQTKLS